MSNPQQPELRRSDKGGATPQDSGARKASQPGRGAGGHAHGTDRGARAAAGAAASRRSSSRTTRSESFPPPRGAP
ncbi:hypothetical protein AB0O04_30885 [Streptomyces althioticus]|uniref:hypothetical protein n=1 Tax=Streptomyces althioticus TaxID=83380 RepID=UPI0034227A3F